MACFSFYEIFYSGPNSKKTMKFTESLKKNEDFRRVYRKGHPRGSRYIVMYVVENGLDENRLGICAGKKIGNSVVRHHFCRLVREAYRLHEDMFNSGLDIVVVANKGAEDATYHDVESALIRLGKQHHIIKKEDAVGIETK